MQKSRKIISALSAAAVFTACAASAGAASLNGYYESFDNIKNSVISTEFGTLTPIGNTAATAKAAGLTQSATDSGDDIGKVSDKGLYAVKLGSSSNYGLGVYNTIATLSFAGSSTVTDSLYFSFDAYQYKNESASDNANTVVKLTDTSNNTIFSYKFNIKKGTVEDVYIGTTLITSTVAGNMNSGNYADNTLAYLEKPIKVKFSLNDGEAELQFSASGETTLTFQNKLSGITSVGAFTIEDHSNDPGRMYTIDNLFAGTSKKPYAVSSVVKKGGRVYGIDNKAADTYVLTVTPYNGTIESVKVDLKNETIEEKSTTISGGSARFGIVVMDDADDAGAEYLDSINESSFDVTCGF